MKFSKNSYWLKSGFYSLLQNVTSLILGFGGFFFLVRVLDKPQMGSWALFISITAIVEVARGGFVKYGFVKFASGADQEGQRKLFTAALVLNSFFAIFVSVLLLLLGSYLSNLWKTEELKQMFTVYSITSIILIPFFQLEYLQQAALDFKKVFFAYFVRNSLPFLAILLSYFGFFQLDLLTLSVLNLLAALLGSVLFFAIVPKPILFSTNIDWHLVKKLMKFGKYVLGTNLSSSLYGAVDQFILGSLVSTSSVAVYGTSARITNLVNTPSTSLSVIVFPQSAKVMHMEGMVGIKELYEKSVAAILGIVLPGVLFILFFTTSVVTIIAGEQYLDVVPILRISIFVCCFLPFAHQFGVTLDSIGLPHINFFFNISLCIVNLTINYFLISRFGIIGASIGSLATAVVAFIAMQIFLRRVMSVEVINIFKNMCQLYRFVFVSIVRFAKNEKLIKP